MNRTHPFPSLKSQNRPLHSSKGRILRQRAFASPMQAVLAAGLARNLAPLGNEAEIEGVAIVGLGNEIATITGDGWARVPYGEWPHELGLQRFSRAEAEEMVGYFRNTWNRIKRAITGLPIYRGHPDWPDVLRKQREALANEAERRALDLRISEMEQRWPDKREYGSIADMEAREDAFYLKPVLTPAGAALVNEGGLKYFSPHWLAKVLGQANGKPIYGPAFLLSIGLTDRPNIAGTSLVNSAPGGADNQNQKEHTMPQWLIELLGLANEAAEERENKAKAKLAELLKRPEPTALANEQTARTTAETQLGEIKGKLTAAETALANERTAHAATTKARNEALVAAAVKEGRITEAAKPVWIGRLDRDFAAESVALANEQGAVKTAPRTGNLGDRKTENTARDQFIALVNEAMPKNDNNWERSWHAVKATAKGKTLFKEMETGKAAS